MKRLPFAGAWYACCLPSGAYAVLYPDSHIETSRGRVYLPSGGNVLFVVCVEWGGVLCLSGQGHDDGQAWLWNGQEWRAVCPTYGLRPCAFGPLGLYVSMPGTAGNVAVIDPITFAKRFPITQVIGSSGIACVTDDGVIHPQIPDCYGQDGLAEFVERDGLKIGQGVPGGLVAAGYGELEPGNVQFIQFNKQADALAVAEWKPDEKMAVCHFLTMDELPMPPQFPTLGRFWLGPNIGSLDELQIFDDLSVLTGVDVFALPVQQILTDDPTPQLGPNTWPNLVAHDLPRKLNAAGIPFVIGMGSIKEWDCDATKNIAGMQTAVQRWRDAGGVVAAVVMDEPLTANQRSDGCHQSLAVCADAVAKFHHAVQALGPIAVGWQEAWPEVGYNIQRLFLIELQKRNAVPQLFQPDIDWIRARKEGMDPVAFIGAAVNLAKEFGMTLGLFVNATKDPIPTDAEHYQNLDILAKRIEMIPNLPETQIVVCSWAHRVSPDPDHRTQNVPYNLGEFGLIASLKNTRTIFGAPIPEPPQPPTEIDSMIYKLMDAVVRVKKLKPSSATGKVVAILPNDKSGSVQPDGSFEERAVGTDGPYEQSYDASNLLLYEPVPGKRYAYPYRVVA